MDFNPLDLLAAAALGDKNSRIDKVGNSDSVADFVEKEHDNKSAIDLEDETKLASMGKSSELNLTDETFDSTTGTKSEDMVPQKLSWNPETFFSESVNLPNKKSDLDTVTDAKIAEISSSSEDNFWSKMELNIDKNIDILEPSLKAGINDESNFNSLLVRSTLSDLSSPEKDHMHYRSDNGQSDEQLSEANAKSEFETELQSDLDLRQNSDTDTADSCEYNQMDVDDYLDCILMDHPYSLPSDSVDWRTSKINNFVYSENKHDMHLNHSHKFYVNSDSDKISNCVDEKCNAQVWKSQELKSQKNDLKDFSSLLSPSKGGKFEIGTFGSFSSSNLELEKYLKKEEVNNGSKASQNSSSNIRDKSFSLKSKCNNQNSSSNILPDIVEKITEWSHPFFHDHDYCVKSTDSKPVAQERIPSKLPLIKRKYTKRRNKLDAASSDKVLKSKYLKKELLKQNILLRAKSSSPELESQTQSSLVKPNPVGRPRKRPLEKCVEEEIDPETGSKMKITGKYQDQYVYYLSKSSRTTSRQRQPPKLPFSADKIIVPAPKPGDIIVPHLSDADIETVRLKGRSALICQERISSNNSICTSSPPEDSMADVDSHIVSTILSMENDNLASPASSQPSDVTSNTELNASQSVTLAEGLASDPGTEHMLNYLLSMVKDVPTESDNLLGAGSVFDSHNSNIFSSLSADAVTENKLVHMEDTDDSLRSHSVGSLNDQQSSTTEQTDDDVKSVETTSTKNSAVNSYHTFDPSRNVSVSLPDLSFISQAQTTSMTSASHADSLTSMKSLFGTDLSEVGALSSAVPRLTSIEKTLDYLGVKDGEIKLDDETIYESKSVETEDSLSIPNQNTMEDETPWIVTVTLYFNDVPAIMVNNEPFIRLVDIHKQILPAKDTGILKKRCQLLKIPVLNCSEMQRYFVVRYGRAYNSKSTLIVSKKQATTLVSYYASPQPRLGRVEETNKKRLDSSSSTDGNLVSPIENPQVSQNTTKKKVAKLVTKSTVPYRVSQEESKPVCESPLSESRTQAAEYSHSKRTRHKKINYREMLKGEKLEEKTGSADLVLETIESVIKSGANYLSNQKVQSNKLEKPLTKTNICDNSKKSSKNRKYFDRCLSKVIPNQHEKNKVDEDSLLNDSNNTTPGKAKHRPLKLKMKSLFNFTYSNKSGMSASSSLNNSGKNLRKKGLFSRSKTSRVLAVAHQAALSNDTCDTRLPSQPADIHLDLFTNSNSPCVRCRTCSQFLSVPHFMQHHHVAMDNEWLATEAAQRVLVPMNKENISNLEKSLWEEFHRLQEAIGGFGEADDEDDSDLDFDEQPDMDASDEFVSKMSKLVHTSHTNPKDIPGGDSETIKKLNCESSKSTVHSPRNTLNMRASSRKKKSKQLFSIENYYTPKKSCLSDEDKKSFTESVRNTESVNTQIL